MEKKKIGKNISSYCQKTFSQIFLEFGQKRLISHDSSKQSQNQNKKNPPKMENLGRSGT